MIQFSCSCGRPLQVPEGSTVNSVRCPACGQLQTVPAGAEARPFASAESGARRGSSDLHLLADEPTPPTRQAPVAANYKAAWSLGLGLLAIALVPMAGLLGFSFGILAIILGVLAVRDIGRSIGRMAGLRASAIGVFAGAFACLIAVAIPLEVGTHGAPRTQSANNLRQLALAMNTYCLTFNGEFPPAGGGPGIHPQLSWRVTLLPFMEEENLYSAFHLKEPWDSPHNRTLLERMPKVYLVPGTSDATGMTRYRVFVGDRAAFEKPVADGKPPRGRRYADFPGGAGNTIFVVEAADPVPWTKPDELEYDPDKPLPRLNDRFARIQAAMGDASVRSIEFNTSDLELRKMIERRMPKPAGDEAEK
jgi:Protein of unknown function (DUF1559)